MTSEFKIIHESLSDSDARQRGYLLFAGCCVLLIPFLVWFVSTSGLDGALLSITFGAFTTWVLFQAFVWSHHKEPVDLYTIIIGDKHLSIYSGDKRTIYWHQKVADITEVCIENESSDYPALLIRTNTDSYGILLGRGAGLRGYEWSRNVKVKGRSLKQLVSELENLTLGCTNSLPL